MHGPGNINHLNVELNPIYHFLELLGAHHILHISRIRVKLKGWCSVLSTYGGRLLQSCCIFCLPQIIQTQGPLAQLHVTFKFRLITKHTHTHTYYYITPICEIMIYSKTEGIDDGVTSETSLICIGILPTVTLYTAHSTMFQQQTAFVFR